MKMFNDIVSSFLISSDTAFAFSPPLSYFDPHLSNTCDDVAWMETFLFSFIISERKVSCLLGLSLLLSLSVRAKGWWWKRRHNFLWSLNHFLLILISIKDFFMSLHSSCLYFYNYYQSFQITNFSHEIMSQVVV